MEYADSERREFAVDVARARAFVLAAGGPREAARLEGILGRGQPDRSLVRELERLQNQDGGFPLDEHPGAPSSVAATCRILAQLREIPPLGGSPMASRAVAFLRRSQHHDGFWTEPPGLVAAVPGEKRESVPEEEQGTAPGEERGTAPGEGRAAALGPSQAADSQAALHLTAWAAYTLLVMDPAHVDPIRRAARWLRRELVAAGAAERAGAATLFLAAAVWAKAAGPGAPETAGAYDLIARRAPGAHTLAWWLTTVVETGLEARFFPLILRQLRRLAAMQREDGSFPGEGAVSAVESTLAALRVFRGFGLI